MKVKELSFPFIYFSESGLFQWVTADSNKKFLLPIFLLAVGPVSQAGPVPATWESLSLILFFVNRMSFCAFTDSLPARGRPAVGRRIGH
jgi:hypothetical protein